MGWGSGEQHDIMRYSCIFGQKIRPIQQIRRKPLPQGFCYVCSRLDPEGKFRNHPHAYLFSKGFFQHCEHVPKTPYPTVIIDSLRASPSHEFSNPRETTRLSVQVKVTPRRSTRSPSPTERYGKKYFDTSILRKSMDDLETRSDSAKYRVSSAFDKRRNLAPISPGIMSGLVPLPTPDSGRRVLQAGDKTFAEAEKMEERWIDFSDGEESDLEWGETDLGKESVLVSEEVKLPPIVQKEDSEERFEVIDESVERIKESIDRLEGRTPRKRPNAGRSRNSDDDDASHLKYHHREENENVPVSGLEIPSSRETLDSRQSSSKFTAETPSEVEVVKSRRSSENSMMLQETPSMIIARINNSAHWCECKDVDLSTIKCPECYVLGGHEKWCIYARSSSNEGFPCPKCGKPIKRNTILGPASYKHSRSSRQSHSTAKSETSDRSRGMLGDEDGRRVRWEDELDAHGKERHNQELENLRTKVETDEDYMSVDDIMNDKERYGKLWTPTSQDEQNSPKPWTKIDPEIHRKAYLKALMHVNINKIKKLEEIDEHYYANRLRRPNVFSYFKLRPHQEKANAAEGGPIQIGLTPDPGPIPTARKAMGHIFGKIKVNDFYPGGKHNPRLTMSLQEEAKKQTMPVHSLRYSRS
ncbi:hypothetical protein FSP39_016317 [Pinctada imbricata]|uniref:Uncharacterized protein n=1 Tax=Pinctada imbricata TaxID=66713 RepID=A0AA88XVZ0_PINIB|nr:hypothetical protein FSP39_016317 [Pinctada imbricata]